MRAVFRVAAGPRVGFGHLVRCRSLARALGVTPLVSIRGTARTRAKAVAMGFTVISSQWPALENGIPDLIVVDDPVQKSADSWAKHARRDGVPVASVHDLGLAYIASDLVIDGSLSTFSRDGVASGFSRSESTACLGPRFAILDPSIAAIRNERRVPVPGRVLIALGGGSHVLSLAGQLSVAIARRSPDAEIRVVRGFSSGRQSAALRHATWVDAPNGLGHELADAEVAVVAGGVTLYEACALGIPVVALPVTAAQHTTVRAAACRGAAIDTGRPPVDDCMMSRTADAVAALLQNQALRHRQSYAARALVDGEGAARVAARLKELVMRRAA